MLIAVELSDHIPLLHFSALDKPMVGLRGIVEGILIYFTPGIIGAWIAVRLVNELMLRYFSK
jgi:hypothetical protein